MKKINHSANVILAIATFQLLLTSCCNYYRAVSSPLKNDSDKAMRIDSLRHANRTFILRNSEYAFYMDSLVISADKKAISCSLDTLSVFNGLHLANGRRGKMRYQKNTDMGVLTEVHIYIDRDTTIVAGKNSLELDKVKKIEVIEKDKQRTTESYLLGGLAIMVVVGGIVVAIAAASLSSMSFGLTGF